jgi:phosphoglycerate dehydrogenase-like enzyme
MLYTSRTLHIVHPSLPDTAMRGRILNGCWLLAAAGISIAQMLLLSQAWRQDQHAAPTACVASAWLVGTLLGGVVTRALRRHSAPPAIVWGAAFLGSALGWRTWETWETWAPPVGHASAFPLMPDLVARTLPLVGMALLLGLLSSLWLGQQRSWAAIGERTALVRNAVCLTFGLLIMWCYPHWSETIGLLCLLPLLLLDLLTAQLDPRPSWGGMTGRLLEQRADPARWSPLRLERRASVAGWWRTYLVRRGYAAPTLLATGTAILLGAVWNAVPTPFAAGLAGTGELNKLTWLFAGQLAALAVGAWLLNRSRGLVGAPDRLVPLPLRTLAWRLAWLSLAGISVSLVLLGLPRLQGPWWLALSLGTYTLAAAAWGVLLPRLRPGISTEVFAQGHLAFGRGRVMRSGYLAYEQALENRFSLVLSTGEGLMTAICAPVVGLLIDRVTVDRTLIFIGLVLAWFLVTVLVANAARISDQLFARPATSAVTVHQPNRVAYLKSSREDTLVTKVVQNSATNEMRILVADRIAQEGIDLLREELPEAHIDIQPDLGPEQLLARIGHYAALIVRSETQVTAPILAAAERLKIVGRAGVGVDNIDIDAATRKGILVVNAPTGNIIAAAEHTIAMLMALARHIPSANSSMKAGKWEKSRFLGVEVRQKTLGIIGLGKVGKEVARRAQGLDMQVIAFDPYVSPERAGEFGVTMLSLEEVLQQADFVTLHTSLTSGPQGTRGLLGAHELRLLKPGARLINCARGGLIDEEALLDALNEKRLAGVALDVFSQEPVRDDEVLRQLLAHPLVIATPHLGGSTVEAQVNVAIDVARQVISALRESASTPVNTMTYALTT